MKLPQLILILAFLVIFKSGYSQSGLRPPGIYEVGDTTIEVYNWKDPYTIREFKIINGTETILYRSFSRLTKKIQEEGAFKGGYSSGNWKFYGWTGRLKKEINYDNAVKTCYEKKVELHPEEVFDFEKYKADSIFVEKYRRSKNPAAKASPVLAAKKIQPTKQVTDSIKHNEDSIFVEKHNRLKKELQVDNPATPVVVIKVDAPASAVSASTTAATEPVDTSATGETTANATAAPVPVKKKGASGYVPPAAKQNTDATVAPVAESIKKEPGANTAATAKPAPAKNTEPVTNAPASAKPVTTPSAAPAEPAKKEPAANTTVAAKQDPVKKTQPAAADPVKTNSAVTPEAIGENSEKAPAATPAATPAPVKKSGTSGYVPPSAKQEDAAASPAEPAKKETTVNTTTTVKPAAAKKPGSATNTTVPAKQADLDAASPAEPVKKEPTVNATTTVKPAVAKKAETSTNTTVPAKQADASPTAPVTKEPAAITPAAVQPAPAKKAEPTAVAPAPMKQKTDVTPAAQVEATKEAAATITAPKQEPVKKTGSSAYVPPSAKQNTDAAPAAPAENMEKHTNEIEPVKPAPAKKIKSSAYVPPLAKKDTTVAPTAGNLKKEAEVKADTETKPAAPIKKTTPAANAPAPVKQKETSAVSTEEQPGESLKAINNNTEKISDAKTSGAEETASAIPQDAEQIRGLPQEQQQEREVTYAGVTDQEKIESQETASVADVKAKQTDDQEQEIAENNTEEIKIAKEILLPESPADSTKEEKEPAPIKKNNVEQNHYYGWGKSGNWFEISNLHPNEFMMRYDIRMDDKARFSFYEFALDSIGKLKKGKIIETVSNIKKQPVLSFSMADSLALVYGMLAMDKPFSHVMEYHIDSTQAGNGKLALFITGMPYDKRMEAEKITEPFYYIVLDPWTGELISKGKGDAITDLDSELSTRLTRLVENQDMQ